MNSQLNHIAGYWQAVRMYSYTILFIFIFGPFAVSEVHPGMPIWVLIIRILFAIPWFFWIILRNIFKTDKIISALNIGVLAAIGMDYVLDTNLTCYVMAACYLILAMRTDEANQMT